MSAIPRKRVVAMLLLCKLVPKLIDGAVSKQKSEAADVYLCS